MRLTECVLICHGSLELYKKIKYGFWVTHIGHSLSWKYIYAHGFVFFLFFSFLLRAKGSGINASTVRPESNKNYSVLGFGGTHAKSHIN